MIADAQEYRTFERLDRDRRALRYRIPAPRPGGSASDEAGLVETPGRRRLDRIAGFAGAIEEVAPSPPDLVRRRVRGHSLRQVRRMGLSHEPCRQQCVLGAAGPAVDAEA